MKFTRNPNSPLTQFTPSQRLATTTRKTRSPNNPFWHTWPSLSETRFRVSEKRGHGEVGLGSADLLRLSDRVVQAGEGGGLAEVVAGGFGGFEEVVDDLWVLF